MGSISYTHQEMFNANIFVNFIPMEPRTAPADLIGLTLAGRGIQQPGKKASGTLNLRPSANSTHRLSGSK